jgi:hypothetical protein
MRFTRFAPVALLALALACSDNSANNPVETGGPEFASAHFIGTASCTQSGSDLLCNFKVSGLGNISTATVVVTAPFSCTKTNGGEQFVQPGGLASGSQQNVPVSNGQITETNFVVSGARCPDAFNPTFSGNATLTISSGGQTLFTGTIPITTTTT